MGDRILEPVERGAFQVRSAKHECHLVGVIWEILTAECDVGSLHEVRHINNVIL